MMVSTISFTISSYALLLIGNSFDHTSVIKHILIFVEDMEAQNTEPPKKKTRKPPTRKNNSKLLSNADIDIEKM